MCNNYFYFYFNQRIFDKIVSCYCYLKYHGIAQLSGFVLWYYPDDDIDFDDNSYYCCCFCVFVLKQPAVE